MKKLILLTLLLTLSINTLSFAQETEKPKKERNWIVGIGGGIPKYESDYSYRTPMTSTVLSNLTVGYKGITVSGYVWSTFSEYFFTEDTSIDYFNDFIITLGYQHVFSKKSNAKMKPIIGLEHGLVSIVLNAGVRYKRSQVLLSVITHGNRTQFIPLLEKRNSENFVSLKYQFLF